MTLANKNMVSLIESQNKSNIEKKELISRFNKLDYSNSLNTARQNSMGRGELVSLYTDFINSKL